MGSSVLELYSKHIKEYLTIPFFVRNEDRQGLICRRRPLSIVPILYIYVTKS
ncbi:uncharacterized protein METZ01_LOCUS135324 [marine metagenome]|uniref:Uncharacterized protein n=1 Tax=marine metagenome TaxID=408172 RepID=A0A381YZU0_9ZZZZ